MSKEEETKTEIILGDRSVAPVKTAKLGDFLSGADIHKAQRLYPDVNAICRDVIEPQIEEINRKLGQPNDPRYLSYMLIYAFERMARAR